MTASAKIFTDKANQIAVGMNIQKPPGWYLHARMPATSFPGRCSRDLPPYDPEATSAKPGLFSPHNTELEALKAPWSSSIVLSTTLEGARRQGA
jgi:hypothetical protein